jgi:hypothetical protein
MYVLGWLVILVGVVFGVMGGLANLLLAHNYGEFWVLNLPVAVIGLGLGRYLVERGDRRSPDVSRS